MKKTLSLKTRDALLAGLKENSFLNSSPNNRVNTKKFADAESFIASFKDPQMFMERHVKVYDPNKGAVRFKLNSKQKKMLERIEGAGSIYDVVGQRQIGTTTLLCAYILWYAIMNPGRTIVSMSTTNQQALNVRHVFKVMLEGLPEGYTPPLVKNNQQVIQFENGTYINFTGSNVDALRGYSISLAVMHDYEYFSQQAKDYLGEVIPYCTPHGKPVYL